MSKIIATDDFTTRNWNIDLENLGAFYADLCIGFTDVEPIVTFKNLKFSFELKGDGVVEHAKQYPPKGVKYVSSDQKYKVIERLKLVPDREYSLYMWAENGGESFENAVQFTGKRPDKPYDSWSWDAEKLAWVAPVPYPDDDKEYTWNEETQQWDEVVEGDGETV